MKEMARFVFITGGVVSSLGKGLATATLGALLKSRGYEVRLKKFDPYLNVDPGTMSPFEHGEVFVTDDGAETDLDLGHYERFTGVNATRDDSISAGRIYQTVLAKERDGEEVTRSGRSSYLGKTIQVIPHVTDEIKNCLEYGEEDVDFVLCEIGGTVGDIEGLPFLEAIRQFSQGRHLGLCVFVHVTLLPYLSTTGELKTKPTQHSVKELRSIGIAPDIILCRFKMGDQDTGDSPVPDPEKRKISLLSGVPKKNIISAPDLDMIYDAPLKYYKEKFDETGDKDNGLDEAVLRCFEKLDRTYSEVDGLNEKPRRPGKLSKPGKLELKPHEDLSKWEKVCESIHRAKGSEGEVAIAIVGKYTRLEDAYKSIAEALTHASIANGVKVIPKWVDAEIFEKGDPAPYLEDFHAILVPGGFDKRGTEGMIRAAQFARERRVPYLGICLGMQLAVIEAARNTAGIEAAHSEEFFGNDEKTEIEAVVYHLDKWIEGHEEVKRKITDKKGGTMRLGAFDAILTEGSRVAGIYGKTRISERHRHRYEVNPNYRGKLEKAGLVFSGKSADDLSRDGYLPEIVEWPDHPWFIGVQFHPELKSKPFDPHPLFKDFVRAAKKDSHLV